MGFDGRFLAGLADDRVDVALGLFDLLLDARGVDPPVGDEAGEREAADFAADGGRSLRS